MGERVQGVRDRVSGVGGAVADSGERVRDRLSGAGERVRGARDDVREATVGRAAEAGDDIQGGLDDRVRDWTGDRVGVSGDWTSTDDAGGFGGVFGEGVDLVDDTVNVTTDDRPEEGYGGIGQGAQDVLTRGELEVGDREIPIGSESIREEIADRYEVGSYAGQYFPESDFEPDVDPEDQTVTQEFFGSAAQELVAGPTTTVQETGAFGIEAMQAGDYIVRGEDGELDPGDFREATGYRYGGFADQFFDDSVTDGDRGRAAEVTDETIETAEETAEYAAANPAQAGGALFGGAVWAGPASVATGSALSSGARAARGRVRTAGGTRIDPGDLTNQRTVRYFGGEIDDPDARFPGAQDPDLYRSDPAEAVRRQADEFTPDEVTERFAEAGVDEGTVLKKGLDVEPEGPGRGRAARGFESAPGETLADFDYETPGAFVGPELSPNFLGVGERGATSLRPGLPDLGDSPTGVLIRTDVENPRASTLEEFNQEMVDRAGETTARTKPASEINTGEIEAVIPPGSEFTDIGGGPVRNTLRNFGIGSDFYTEVGGERVPLRPVRPAGAGGDVDVPEGITPAFEGEALSSLYRPPGQSVDRPFPTPAGGGGLFGEVDIDPAPDVDEYTGGFGEGDSLGAYGPDEPSVP
ncbi:MAG: hypothetical protein ACOCS7_02535, partial [Halolamina sp.]